MINSFALKQENYNYIGRNGSIKGDFETKGPTIIQGKVTGNVICHNNAVLRIDKEGYIDGNLTCFDLEVYGTIKGQVNSKGKITLYPNSNVQGDLESKELKIHPGSHVNGDLKTTKS